MGRSNWWAPGPLTRLHERIGISEVADGLYQLKVELSNADHTAVEPYAGDFVYVTVDATRCPEP